MSNALFIFIIKSALSHSQPIYWINWARALWHIPKAKSSASAEFNLQNQFFIGSVSSELLHGTYSLEKISWEIKFFKKIEFTCDWRATLLLNLLNLKHLPGIDLIYHDAQRVICGFNSILQFSYFILERCFMHEFPFGIRLMWSPANINKELKIHIHREQTELATWIALKSTLIFGVK